MIKIKFIKNNPNAQLPERIHGNRKKLPDDQDIIFYHDGSIKGTGDSGYDIFACEDSYVPARGSKIIETGLQVAYIQNGYWFKIESRSGLSFRAGILCHPGIIDNAYRGNLSIKLFNHSDKEHAIKSGDKIAQMVIYKVYDTELEWTDTISETSRGANGFGSTGR